MNLIIAIVVFLMIEDPRLTPIGVDALQDSIVPIILILTNRINLSLKDELSQILENREKENWDNFQSFASVKPKLNVLKRVVKNEILDEATAKMSAILLAGMIALTPFYSLKDTIESFLSLGIRSSEISVEAMVGIMLGKIFLLCLLFANKSKGFDQAVLRSLILHLGGDVLLIAVTMVSIILPKAVGLGITVIILCLLANKVRKETIRNFQGIIMMYLNLILDFYPERGKERYRRIKNSIVSDFI